MAIHSEGPDYPNMGHIGPLSTVICGVLAKWRLCAVSGSAARSCIHVLCVQSGQFVRSFSSFKDLEPIQEEHLPCSTVCVCF